MGIPTNVGHRPLVSLYTLGCKLNQYETDSIATELQKRNFRVVQDINSQAKYIVINTCTVTSKADRKSRNIIYRALKHKIKETIHTKLESSPLLVAQTSSADRVFLPSHPDSHKGENIGAHKDPVLSQDCIVIVTGCFVGTGTEELESMGLDYIVDNSKKKYIPDIIDSHEQGQILDFNKLKSDYFDYTTSDNMFRIRSNLKIQDGCDNFCTFCIIPTVRGSAKSRSLVDILHDARVLAEQGTKEIILTGVNMSRYEHGGHVFSNVLEGLLKLPYDFRLRISSLEPDQLDDRFFDLLDHPRLCPHLHLCLQSGSDKILLKMRRMYNTREFMQGIERIKKKIPLINLTTDAIVGFPSESKEDFEATKSIIRHAAFSHTHIFPYSDREGTRASRMSDKVPLDIKKARVKNLEELNLELKNTYRLLHKESTQHVLVENISSDALSQSTLASGLSEYYLPIEILADTPHKDLPNLRKNTITPVQLNTHRINEQGEIILQQKLTTLHN